MPAERLCTDCGAELSPDTQGGLCVRCLFRLGLNAGTGTEVPASAAPITEKPGDRIDRYKLLQKIGEGGCGVVYMADQEEPVRRRVALKVIKLGMDTRAVIARFEAERQALAMMDHPNIARVLDAGQTTTGRPFFVMELVKGVRITEYCDQNNLPTRERLALFTQVCQAIQHAHQKGIIHRDIKPSNILVTLHDGVPVPKVIDFGIAKAINQQRLTDLTLFTALGQLIGTPAYMSPEQAEMSGLDIDTRSDIYSLGVLLYELLTGRTPFDAAQLVQAGLDEVRRIIREQEPPKPSTRLSTLAAADLTVVAKHRQCEPARLSHLVRGDLDWIVMKCLEKDRTRRYETSSGLAADIQRHLQNEPVLAGPPSKLYRFQKTIRRHKLAFAATAAVIVSLAIGLVASTIMFFREQAALGGEKAARSEVVQKNNELERKRAEVERKNAEFRAMLAEAARSDCFVAEEKLRAGQEQEAFAHLARACEYDPSSTMAAEKAVAALGNWSHELPNTILAGHTKRVQSAQFSSDGIRIVTASSDNTACVWDVATGHILVRLTGHTGAVWSAEFSRDGALIVTGSHDNTARVWDSATGKTLVTLTGHNKALSSAHFSPDGTRIVTASADRTARVWTATGKLLATLAGHEAGLSSAEFNPDGARILTASEDRTARVWSPTTGETVATLTGHDKRLWSAHFSPDGTRIVTASADKTARVWDAQSGNALVTLTGHEGEVASAWFSPDGTRIVTAGMGDKPVRVWDAGTGELLKALVGHKGHIANARFSPNGDRIVSASFTEADSTARIWDASTGNLLATLTGHERVTSAQFSPDGKHIVTASSDSTARVWEVGARKMSMTFTGHEGPLLSAQFSADGTRILTTSFDKTARVWDAVTGRMLAKLAPPEGLLSAWFSPDAKRIVTLSAGKAPHTARVLDAITGDLLTTFPGVHASFSPDSTRIVTITNSLDKTAQVRDAATGQILMTLIGHTEAVGRAQFSADGKRILTETASLFRGNALVWDAVTGKMLATFVGAGYFSPDGTRIATVSADKTVRVWDAVTGNALVTLPGHEGIVYGVQFSSDGTRIVTASRMGGIRIWDVNTGKILATLEGGGLSGYVLQFSPDSTRIIANSLIANLQRPTARVWDATTGKALATLAHEDLVTSVHFSPDATRIVTTSRDRTARVWEASTGKLLATLAGHEAGVGSAQFSPDSTRILTASADKTARVWDVLPPSAVPPPEWFADFLRYMAQMRLNSDGELEQLKPADWPALRERLRGVLRASAGDDTPYLRILRKYVRE